MSVTYGEAVDQKPLSREPLENQLRSITERSEQILYILKHMPEDCEQAVELRAELAIYRAQAGEIKRILNPDAEATERRRQFEAGLKAQAAEMAARHAPIPAEVLEQRRHAMRKRRKEHLDVREREAKEVLLDQIDRWEKSGQWRDARILRVQLTNLRAQLEKEIPE
jgi:hypothetical protein